MSKLDHALAHAAEGFAVFPLLPWPLGDKGSEGKTPRVRYKQWSTRDPETIAAHWRKYPDDNVAIYTGAEDAPTLVIDVDTKKGKDGNDALLALELEGFNLPDTRTVETPTGGKHLYLRVSRPLKQGANVLGPGVDTRSRGGFVVAPGSTIDGKAYEWTNAGAPLLPAPDWLIGRCGVPRERSDGDASLPAHVDPERAMGAALEYLKTAPLAIEGAGGDETTYRVACGVKDRGISEADALAVLVEWNDRCLPPWSHEELAQKVANAYRYGTEAPGAALPQADFKPVAQKMTAAWLLQQEFDPVRWVIDGLLPEGLTILAGKPKLGKSWMALDWAVAVAMGTNAIGKFATTKGESLYLALEDSPRRLASRLEAIGSPDAYGAHFRTDWKQLDAGGLEELNRWLDAHPDCRLVTIDTLAKIKARPERGMSPYDADVKAMAPLQRIAIDRRIAIVVVLHDRKMAADDFIDRISGTLGITGTADSSMLLSRARGQQRARLEITGRDIGECSLVVEFNGKGKWSALDVPPELVFVPPEQQRVLDALAGAPGKALSAPELGRRLDKKKQALWNITDALAEKGGIVKLNDGRWALSEVAGAAAAVFGV
jgi:hypothetical protein